MLKLSNRLYNSVWMQIILYLVIFTFIFFFLGFYNILLDGPFGVHFMRQTDSLSFASNYFNNGFHFFKPQVYNLTNINGKTACEFPITYYLTALLYLIFGKHFFIQRFVHLLIIYIGVFYIFKLSLQVLKDITYAIIISLIVFTSTVFNYYSFNYLPDIPALGFAFIAWYFLIKYIESKQSNNTLILGFVFFTLSSLIKVTYLINPLSVIILAILSAIFFKNNSLVKNSKKIITYGIFAVGIVIVWNIYMLYYNEINNSNTFNTRAIPIWLMSKKSISIIWGHFTNYWYRSYFHPFVFHLLYACILFLIIFLKKVIYRNIFLLVILFLGCLSYFILFYPFFKDHDYYFLAFFPFILLTIVFSFKTIKTISSNKILHWVLKFGLIIIIILGINYSKNKLHNRIITNTMDNKPRLGLLIQSNIEDIKNLNIEANALFVVCPENCQNGGLLYLDKMGWSVRDTKQINLKSIKNYIKLGANYLLVSSNDEFVLAQNEYTKLIYKKNGLNIYKLYPKI